MRHAFDAALESVEARDADASSVAPNIVAALPTEGGNAPSGRHSLWELAAEWTPEADPKPPRVESPPPAAPPPSALPEDIARELDLAALRTPVDLARARRRFMWENHPDRRKDIDRDLANRRVALANMLLDRTLAVLRQRRGK